MSTTAVLVEAKKELTKHIINRLTPFFYEEFRKMHNNCINHCSNTGEDVIIVFGNRLKDVPEWNQTLIDELFERLQKSCNSEILSNLIKSVWISNVQILSAVRINNNQSETEVNVPDPKRFVHKCFVEVARDIHKNPFLFQPNVSDIERHRNQRDILKLAGKATKEAIRKMLPVDSILKQYLQPGASAAKKSAAGKTVQDEISDQELKNLLSEIHQNEKQAAPSKPDADVKTVKRRGF